MFLERVCQDGQVELVLQEPIGRESDLGLRGAPRIHPLDLLLKLRSDHLLRHFGHFLLRDWGKFWRSGPSSPRRFHRPFPRIRTSFFSAFCLRRHRGRAKVRPIFNFVKQTFSVISALSHSYFTPNATPWIESITYRTYVKESNQSYKHFTIIIYDSK